MIQYTGHRTRGNEPPFDPITRTETVAKALSGLILYEIGYGGSIIELTPMKVAVRTVVMGCVDTSIWEGLPEEMELLVEAAAASVMAAPSITSGPLHEAIVTKVMNLTKGKPLLIKLGMGMITGAPRAKLVMLSLLPEPLTDEELIKKLIRLTPNDLLALVMCVRVDGMTLKEALDLATLEVTYDALGKSNGSKQPEAV